MQCTIHECNKKLVARGYCRAHYSLWHKHGKPERIIGRHGRNLKDPTYLSWSAMRARCMRGKYKDRISICDRWMEVDGFDNFLKDMGERPIGTTLDRVNNLGNYEPTNCRWATAKQQRLNNSQIHLVEYSGNSKPLSVHCEDTNMPYLVVFKRLKRGWTPERAFTEKIRST